MPILTKIPPRQLEPEWMDRPDLPPEKHTHALNGIARINLLSLSADIVWSPIRRLAKGNGAHPLRVLDVACGAGDVAAAIWRRARRARLPLEIDGCDKSPHAIAHARARADAQNAQAGFHVHDVLEHGIPDGYDVVMSSLFLHHLDSEQAAGFLREMARAARHLVVVNDLRRCRAGIGLAHLACYTLSRSEVVRYDGVRSVAAAFSESELRSLAESAALGGVSITRHWPFRLRLVWRRP